MIAKQCFLMSEKIKNLKVFQKESHHPVPDAIVKKYFRTLSYFMTLQQQKYTKRKKTKVANKKFPLKNII